MNDVTLVIEGGPDFEIAYSTGMTVRTLLEAAYNSLLPSPVTTFAYNLEFYGAESPNPLGYLVSMINGTFDSFNAAQSPYYFWEFLVNNNPASNGIDYTVLEDGDVVKFQFVQYVPEMHAGTVLEAKFKARIALLK